MPSSDDFLDSTQEVTITADRDALMRKDTVRATGQAMLIVMTGGRVGERFRLGDEDCVMGRGKDASLQLEGDSISRIHARVQRHDGEFFLVDCNSTNGCYVNYVRVSEKRLQDGDSIQIGQAQLKFLSGDNIETAYHEEARRLVRRDALTGALNRTTFDEELRAAVRKALSGELPLSLISFDLDHFKAINDTRGHTAGDLVLREVGRVVDEVVSAPHYFARVGGEEFCVIFRGEFEDALARAEKIRIVIEKLLVVYEGKPIPVTASVGVVSHQRDMVPRDLYEAADKKLYEAKLLGRNRVVS